MDEREWTLEDRANVNRDVKSTYRGADEDIEFSGALLPHADNGHYTLQLNVDQRHIATAEYDLALNQLNVTYSRDDQNLLTMMQNFELKVPESIAKVYVMDQGDVTFSGLNP